MTELHGTATHANLIAAFARESQANQRYLWFAQQADVDGRPDAAALFRSIADGETGHANDLLEFLVDAGDPVSGAPIGDTDANLAAAIDAESYECSELFPAFAATARSEGFAHIADWFDSLARAERQQVERLRNGRVGGEPR